MDRGLFRFEGYELDLAARELRNGHTSVAVERQVFDVLAYLLHHRDRVVPRTELLDTIWGDRFVSDSALSSRIKSARRATGDDGDRQRVIRTVRGVGFRFIAPVEEVLEPIDSPAVDRSATPVSPDLPALVVDVPEIVEIDASAPLDEEVRRVVVVVAQEDSAGASAEDLRAVRDRLAADIGRLVAQIGGRLERAWGGQVVIVFGMPAHDDDALRAHSLASEIVRLRPAARVAVATGEAVLSVSPDQEVIAGKVLDLAQVLMSAARPGVVEVDEHVAAMLDPHVEDEDMPFVGRRSELQSIRELWHRVADDGAARVLEITGEAGIGKTGLVAAALDELDPKPVEVLELSFSSFALPATSNLIARLAADHPSIEAWLDRFDVSDGERAALAAQLRPFVSDSRDDREPAGPGAGIVSTFVRLVQLLAESGPVVVVLEDLHWAPGGITEWLADAALVLANRPVLAIFTSRPQPERPSFDLDPAAERAMLRLGPLPPDDLRDLAAGATGGLADETIADVAARSGGSPLFLLQYLRMLREGPDDDAGASPPESVRLVISARLDHLPPVQRRTLHAASVLDQTLRVDGLAALTGARPDEERATAVALARAGLLRPVRGSDVTLPIENRSYVFDHAVVADVAYSQLTRERRVDLHRRAARWLDGEAGEHLDDLRAAAWHWRQVLQLAGFAGDAVGEEDRLAARRSFERAADRLLHVDVRMAIHYFEDALALTSERPEDRAAVELHLGLIHTDAGNLAAADAYLTSAAATFDELGLPARAGEALSRQARALWFSGEGDRVDRLLGEAIERFERTPPGPSHAVGYVIAATQAAVSGEAEEALDLVERAMPIAEEHGTREDVVRLLHACGAARFDLDDPDGVEDMQEALDASLEHGLSRLASQSYNNLAELLWMSSGPEEARGLAVSGIELAEQRGLLAQLAWHRAQIAQLDADLGEWDRALDIEHRRDQLSPMVEIVSGVVGAKVRFWRGDDDQLRCLERQVVAARTTRTGQLSVPALASLVYVSALVGEPDQAVEAATELHSSTIGQPQYRLRETGDAIRGLLHVGRVDLARSLVPPGRPRIRRRALMWETACAAIAAHENRSDHAVAGFHRAETGWVEFGNQYEAAHAALGLAQVATAIGDHATADAAVGRARARAELMGATRLDAAAEAMR